MFEARIIGTGSYLPEDTLTNETLYGKISGFDAARSRESFAKRGEDVSGLSDAQVFDKWVRQVCGIGERHIFGAKDVAAFGKPDLYDVHRNCEAMGAMAAERAIAMAGIDRAEIDTVIFSTVTSDTLIPNPAVLASYFLGLGEVATITTNTACSGFLDAMGDAWSRIRSGLSKTVLVISSEQFSGRIHYEDVTTAILFGDGAGAAILTRSEEPGIKSWWAGSRFSTNIAMNYNGPVVMGGGPLVQKNAVNAMNTASTKAMEMAGVTMNDIHLVVPHQANARILLELARKFGVPEEKVVIVIEKIANISTATIPVALDIYRRGGLAGRPYKPGALLLGTSVGGGYAYTGSVFSL